MEKKKKEGTPYECMQCHFWKVEEAFDAESIGYRHFRRICKDCEEKRLCRGECYNPSDERRKISRIEVVRIHPQVTGNEEIMPSGTP